MKRKKEVLWGVLLLLGAVFIVVNKLGFFHEIGVVTVIFTIVLAGILISNLFYRSFGGVLFPIACLCILFDEQLGIESLTPWPVLAVALLGTIGLNMIFRKKHREWKYEKKHNWNASQYQEIIDEEGEEWVRCEVSFSSTAKYINSTHFKKADLEVSFGSMSVYFDNALIDGGKAVAKVEVSFGNMELYIPKSWKVVLDLDTSFGGCKEHGGNGAAGEDNILMITGDVSFGGMDIYYI